MLLNWVLVRGILIVLSEDFVKALAADVGDKESAVAC